MSAAIIDPATLTYCPCGARIQLGKEGDYFVCRACWITAPEYFRIKFNSKIPFRREQARNQISNHARRRAK